jgi:F0F1-type ATP synthase assembly protein I
MQNARVNLRFIWAEKIVLTLAALGAAIAAFGWVLVALAAGMTGANHVLASIGADGALEITAVLFAVWATFRAMDFAFGGSTYKLFHAEREDAAVLPVAGKLLAH